MVRRFPRHPGPYHVHLVPHSHLDVEWYWTFDRTRAWSRTIFRDVIGLLREDREETFTQDQTPLLELMVELAGREEVRRWTEEGRFEAACGGFVQPEVAEPHGECLIRNILLGRKRTRELFGAAPRTGWFVDTFGQIPQIAQILSGCGMSSWVFERGVPEELGEAPTAFRYESPDGTRILTYRLASGYCTTEENLEDSLRTEIEHASTEHILLCWGQDVSNPAEMPARWAKGEIERIAEMRGIPLASVSITTPAAYFAHLRRRADELPVLKHDFAPPEDRFADLRGTYSNRVRLKLLNRRAENLLIAAEAWDALAPVGPGSADPTLSSGEAAIAWEKLLYNHFHDIMGGSCTDQVYEKALRRFGTVIDLSEDIMDRALDRLVREVDTTRFAHPVAVFNATSAARTDTVECEMVFRDEPTNVRVVNDEGRAVPFVVSEPRGSRYRSAGRIATAHVTWLASDVPAFGCRVYDVEPCDGRLDTAPVARRETTAENERYRVLVSPETGDLASITDRATGEEYLDGPGNEIVARRESHPSLEGMVRVTGEEERTSRSARKVEIISERTPLCERIRSITRFLGCRLIREVTLYRGVRRIAFRTTFEDFRGGDVIVSVRFPVAVDGKKRRIVYETPYAMTRRDVPDGAHRYHCAGTVVDMSDGTRGLALINTGNAGYWPVGNALDLILFRSIGDFPDYYAPLAGERGAHRYDYAVVPHSGDWRDGRVVAEGHGMNRPFAALPTDRHAGAPASRRSFVAASPANVEVAAMKRAESGDALVVRLYETAGEKTTARLAFGFAVRAAWKATMEEERGEALTLEGDAVMLSLRRCEIATVLIERR